MKDIDAELADIFGVPVDGSNLIEANVVEDTDVSVSADAQGDSFTDKAESINEDLSSIEGSEDGIEYIDIEGDDDVKEQTPNDIERVIEKSIPGVSDKSQEDREVGDESPDEDDLPEPEISDDNGSEVQVEHSSNADCKSEFPEIMTEDGWRYTTKDSRFVSFYEWKQNTIPKLLPGGVMPFDDIAEELANARPNIKNIDMYDLQAIYEAMHDLQKWQTRVTEIQISLNRQYCLWKRAIPHFHGLLMRCVYEKPAAKQEGLNIIHMNDMENYYANLEGSVENAKSILRNLESAFDFLSRVVTLSMPQKSVERRLDPVEEQNNKTNESLSEYDSLDRVESNRNNSKKADNTGWDSV